MLPAIKNAIFLASVLAAPLPQNQPSFHSHVEIVVVPCTVVDANGGAVRDLMRDEFHVYDNDVPKRIENFSIDSDLSLTLGVIIDASESQKEQLSEHRQTAGDLLQQILRPGDHAFTVFVDEDVRLSGGDLLGEACAQRKSNIPGLGPWSACGASPLWNAIYDAARIKLQPATGNKALLMLTDGFDSGSTHTWNQAASALNRADASLYVIQYKSGSGRSFAPDLNRLVAEAGGTRFRAPAGDYRQIVSRIETDLRHRYVLGFRPENLTGKVKHEVRIEVTRPDLSVRARNTYFQDLR